MKKLIHYINEDKNKKQSVERSDIMFTIWEEPDKQITKLKDNNSYLKIEYKFINKTEDINIDFLLGYKDDTWQLWIGKIGSCTYDDEPYKSLHTDKFSEAIIKSIDIIIEFINDVEKNPDDNIQFYKNI